MYNTFTNIKNSQNLMRSLYSQGKVQKSHLHERHTIQESGHLRWEWGNENGVSTQELLEQQCTLS